MKEKSSLRKQGRNEAKKNLIPKATNRNVKKVGRGGRGQAVQMRGRGQRQSGNRDYAGGSAFSVRENPRDRFMKLEGSARWGHDAFQRLDSVNHGQPKAPSMFGTKLYISNLHYEVSSEDIRDLFKPIGTLVSYRVHFDNADRSKGTAEAVFENREDAVKAQGKYNGILLDNMPMKIELLEKSDGDRLSGRLSAPKPTRGSYPRHGSHPRHGKGFQQAISGIARERDHGVRSHVVAMDE